MKNAVVIMTIGLLMSATALACKDIYRLNTAAGALQGQQCFYQMDRHRVRCGFGGRDTKKTYYENPYITCQAVTPGKNLLGTYPNPAFSGRTMPGGQSQKCSVWESASQ